MTKHRWFVLILVAAWTSAWSAMPVPLLGAGAGQAQWDSAAIELQAALECRQRLTASDALRSALGMTNARIGGRYVLPDELTVFGLPVREVLLDDGLDSGVARYGVELPGQDVVALVRAASLHRQNGGWQRQTAFGRLSVKGLATGIVLECREIPGTSESGRR